MEVLVVVRGIREGSGGLDELRNKTGAKSICLPVSDQPSTQLSLTFVLFCGWRIYHSVSCGVD